MLVQAFVFWLGLSAAYASGPTLESPSRSASTSKVSVAWYAGWHAEILPLSKVSWSKYTHLTFAFALVISPIFSVMLLKTLLAKLLPTPTHSMDQTQPY